MISDRGKKNHFSSSNNMFFREERDLFPSYLLFIALNLLEIHFLISQFTRVHILFFDNPFLATGNLARLSLAQLLPSLWRKEIVERRQGEPIKFLFQPKMGLLGNQASTEI